MWQQRMPKIGAILGILCVGFPILATDFQGLLDAKRRHTFYALDNMQNAFTEQSLDATVQRV